MIEDYIYKMQNYVCKEEEHFCKMQNYVCEYEERIYK